MNCVFHHLRLLGSNTIKSTISPLLRSSFKIISKAASRDRYVHTFSNRRPSVTFFQSVIFLWGKTYRACRATQTTAINTFLLLFCTLSLTGCSEIGYYLQGAKGQLEIRSKEQPIDRLIINNETDINLSTKLKTAKDILIFAEKELLLETGRSYQTYADLERPHVVWNIVATPAFDTTPKTWCFPVAGCVSYRGYFSQSEATVFAKMLDAEGYDVHLYGVSAYSTLGWFNDPLLNTFISYPEPELAALIFHELAHQKIYVKGDSRFNEAFAEAVAQEGVARWLATKDATEGKNENGGKKIFSEFKKRREIRAEFSQMIAGFTKELQGAYSEVSTEQLKNKIRVKQEMFAELKNRYQQFKVKWNGYSGYDQTIGNELNNARLTAISTYHELLPAFQKMMVNSQNDLTIFYSKAEDLAILAKDERDEYLKRLTGKD